MPAPSPTATSAGTSTACSPWANGAATATAAAATFTQNGVTVTTAALPASTDANAIAAELNADTNFASSFTASVDDNGGLVVQSTTGLAGAITDGDLRRHIDGLLAHTAGEVMTPGPKKTVPPGMMASEALALMSDPPPSVTVLFVVEDDRPVGILHVHDLLRAGVM